MANGSNSGITLADIRNGKGEWDLDNTIKSNEILAVQSALFFAGYWSGFDRNGIYEAYTVAAVKGFQFECKLTANGKLNKATLNVLENWAGPLSATRNKEPNLTYIRRGTQYATKGDTGSAITQIRKLLNAKGYICSSTGSFNDELLAQVKKCQRDFGLPVSGKVRQMTIAVLEDTTTATGWLTNNTVKLTSGLLAQCGFSGIMLDSNYVVKLNGALNTYGLNTKKSAVFSCAMLCRNQGWTVFDGVRISVWRIKLHR